MHIELSAELRSSKANKLDSTSLSPDSRHTEEANYNPKQKEMHFWRRHGRMLVVGAVLVCLLLTSRVSATSSSSSKAAPPELYSCINDGQPDQQLTTYKDFAYQKPAR
jgi:hypothetical protein